MFLSALVVYCQQCVLWVGDDYYIAGTVVGPRGDEHNDFAYQSERLGCRANMEVFVCFCRIAFPLATPVSCECVMMIVSLAPELSPRAMRITTILRINLSVSFAGQTWRCLFVSVALHSHLPHL